MYRRSFIAALFGLPAIHAGEASSSPSADNVLSASDLRVKTTEAGFAVQYPGGVEIEITRLGWDHPRPVLQSDEAPLRRPV